MAIKFSEPETEEGVEVMEFVVLALKVFEEIIPEIVPEIVSLLVVVV